MWWSASLRIGSLLARYWAPVLIATAFVALGAASVWVYSQGRQHERAVQERERMEALLAMAAEAQRIRDQDMSVLMGAVQREVVIRERIREVRVDVPTPDCRSLGDDWVREANKAIAAASTGGAADAVR
jgi:hypothetical protein